MAAISGSFGKIMIGASTAPDCTAWSWERSCILHAYASCSTSGWKKRVAGTKDHSGSLEGKFSDSDLIDDYFDEGDAVTLHLYVNTTDYYIVPARIENLSIEVDIDDGDIIPWSSSFSGDGQWSSSGLN